MLRRSAHPASKASGFTLLEVMVATSILAVGTVSVLAVFASAVGFANRRQSQAELAQVLEEARSEARSIVDAFRPPAAQTGTQSRNAKNAVSASRLPGGDSGKVAEKGSKVFEGYRYDLTFEELARGVPEAGYRTSIAVKWGEDQQYTETLAVLPTSIPDEEFAFSLSYDEERANKAAGTGRETK